MIVLNTREDIISAVNAGHTVHAGSGSYDVIRNSADPDDYLIVCNFNGSSIGLGGRDGHELNMDRFYIATPRVHIDGQGDYPIGTPEYEHGISLGIATPCEYPNTIEIKPTWGYAAMVCIEVLKSKNVPADTIKFAESELLRMAALLDQNQENAK